MRFWDASALVALLVDQPATARLRPLIGNDADMVVWALSEVEVRSGMERLRREGLSLRSVRRLTRSRTSSGPTCASGIRSIPSKVVLCAARSPSAMTNCLCALRSCL